MGQHIDKDRSGSKPGNGFGSRRKREARAQYCVAGLYILCLQNERQRIRAARTRDDLLCAAETSKVPLENTYLRAQNELAMFKHPGNCGVNFCTKQLPLCAQIDETN